MKTNNLLSVYLLSVLFTISSCKTSNQEQKQENVKQILPIAPAEVTVMPLIKKKFTKELVSNGKLSSQKKAEVYFKSANRITNIYVANGDRVKRGQIIAKLDNYMLKSNLEQAKDAMKRSKLELQDMLIGQGYKLQDTASVPADIMELLKTKSGYNNAQNQYKIARFNYENTTLRSPINGIVANLTSKVNTIANNSKPFCNIIDTKRMEVSFLVLESELSMVQKGASVVVTPFSMPDVTIQGKITEINPWVDENGMVRIKASLNPHRKVIEGMSVRISIFRSLEEQWVVPKTAVVLRTNKKVVFVKKGNKALWNYVNIGLENAKEYTITGKGTLKEGDTIITSGNINLAHESPIKVIK